LYTSEELKARIVEAQGGISNAIASWGGLTPDNAKLVAGLDAAITQFGNMPGSESIVKAMAAQRDAIRNGANKASCDAVNAALAQLYTGLQGLYGSGNIKRLGGGVRVAGTTKGAATGKSGVLHIINNEKLATAYTKNIVTTSAVASNTGVTFSSGAAALAALGVNAKGGSAPRILRDTLGMELRPVEATAA
jgi:hypothetical protein